MLDSSPSKFSLKISIIATREADKAFKSKHFFISPAPEARYKHQIAKMYSQGLSLQLYVPKHMLAPECNGIWAESVFLLSCKFWKIRLILFLHSSDQIKLKKFIGSEIQCRSLFYLKNIILYQTIYFRIISKKLRTYLGFLLRPPEKIDSLFYKKLHVDYSGLPFFHS